MLKGKSSKSHQEEALQLLDDLDSFTPLAKPLDESAPAPGQGPSVQGEAEALAFIDEITQKSAEPTRITTSHLERPTSRAGTPTLRKSTERVRLGSSNTPPSSKPSTPTPAGRTPSSVDPAAQQAGGWGWGSVWTSASAAIQQARTVVDEQVKHLPNNEAARKWGEGVYEYAKTAQLDKLGQDFKRVGLTTLTDLLNVVAPPISEHEVIQIWLSHDMLGYEGVETLVYRSMARILEQVEGGDLVVNRGEESRPKDSDGKERDLNAVEGYEAAVKLAQANLDELIKLKNTSKPKEQAASQTQVPVSYSYVYLRVQPFFTSYALPAKPSEDATASGPKEDSVQQQLQYLLYLSDPSHELVHTTVTQSVPGTWLALWDQHEWVEDLVAETLRVGIEVVGQDYVVARMGSDLSGKTKLEDPAVTTEDEKNAPVDA
ncbi:hypothetical protein CYLTODRAFT_438460 [Cylindrobasidium torrendii FP15055 ss-10]|uniref:Maintenance of telomere capping protein 1 n=1 Tax=Cylindrobasidium torrendii FP15055 ss-10 TaxID=1314674 RepID=A0A0D7AZK6_9AGAR|nr:hypothetical protein CYLTODRAFT_438460 [Cylindrobasidium torrendii FP15055 ss-10]